MVTDSILNFSIGAEEVSMIMGTFGLFKSIAIIGGAFPFV